MKNLDVQTHVSLEQEQGKGFWYQLTRMGRRERSNRGKRSKRSSTSKIARRRGRVRLKTPEALLPGGTGGVDGPAIHPSRVLLHFLLRSSRLDLSLLLPSISVSLQNPLDQNTMLVNPS